MRCYLFFDTCSGLPLRLVEANSSNCFSLIELIHTLGRALELAHWSFAAFGGKSGPSRPLLRLRFRWHPNLRFRTSDGKNAVDLARSL